jgi:hypothetical protein
MEFRRIHKEVLRELRLNATAEPSTPRARSHSPTKMYLKAVLARASAALTEAGFEAAPRPQSPYVWRGAALERRAPPPRLLRRCGTTPQDAAAVHEAAAAAVAEDASRDDGRLDRAQSPLQRPQEGFSCAGELDAPRCSPRRQRRASC